MSASVPQSVSDCLLALHDRAQEFDTQADQLHARAAEAREAAAALRRFYGLDDAKPPVTPWLTNHEPAQVGASAEIPSAEVAADRPKRTVNQPPRPISIDHTAREEATFQAVQALKDCRSGEVAEIIAGHDVPANMTNWYLKRLAEAGRIERYGVGSATRYRLPGSGAFTPAATASDDPAKPEEEESEAAPTSPAALQAEVLNVLKNGASHSVTEMTRALLRGGMVVNQHAVKVVLDHLSTHRYIVRLLDGDEPRYRKKAS